MNDAPNKLAAVLERMYPPLPNAPDWQDVLGRAGYLDGKRACVAHRGTQRAQRACVLAGAVAVAFAFALMLWPASKPSLAERALASLGDAEVLHVVTTRPLPGESLVEIASGNVVIPTQEQEIWFDDEGGRLRTVTRIDGVVQDEQLQTRQGWFTSHGVVYTCAWIAAHPTEATMLRVSCNETMENPGPPRTESEPPPTVDAPLKAFVTGYQHALAIGEARRLGNGSLRGRSVEWIAFTAGGSEQRVALERDTLQPLQVETTGAGGQARVAYDIHLIETIRKENADFSRPRAHPQSQPQPSIANVVGEHAVGVSQATVALGQAPFWLAWEFKGLTISSLKTQELVSRYSERHLPPTSTEGVEISYADAAGKAVIKLQEATSCQLAYAWRCTEPSPPVGYMRVVRWGNQSTGLIVRDGLYVRIVSTLGMQSLLEAARVLQPAR